MQSFVSTFAIIILLIQNMTQLKSFKVAICGGGIAGCTAANRLASKGVEVTVFEVGRGLGGRSSTRRNGDIYFDHGAQYIGKPKTLQFQAILDDWKTRGWVKAWQGNHFLLQYDQEHKSIVHKSDLGTKYVGSPYMNSICKQLTEHPLITTSFGRKVIPKPSNENIWKVFASDSEESIGSYDWVIGAERSCASHLLSLDLSSFNQPSEIGSLISDFAKIVEANFVAVPSLVAMLALKQPILSSLFPFDSLEIVSKMADPENRHSLCWISKDSSKPDRACTAYQTWVLQSSTETAKAILQQVDIELQNQVVSFEQRKKHVNEKSLPVLLEGFKKVLLEEAKSENDRVAIERLLSNDNFQMAVSHRWSAGFPSWKENVEMAFKNKEGFISLGQGRSFIHPQTHFAACGDYLAPASSGHGIEAAVLSGMAAADGVLKAYSMQ